MPTYEYRCNACKRELEVQQRMSDPELVRCEACGADALEKLISWTSVRGSGAGQQDAALYSSNPREAMKATVTRNNIPPKQEAPAPVAEPSVVADAGSTVTDTGSTVTDDADDEPAT
jgi:putative FmdB family regulatory protein